MEPSFFASALKNLLDDTKLFNRKDWAYLIGEEESKIAQWLHDKEIPRSYNLAMILTVLDNSSDVIIEPIKEFRKMAELRSTLVSPHGARMLPTVSEYLSRPAFSLLSSRLAKLNPKQQEELLLEEFPEK